MQANSSGTLGWNITMSQPSWQPYALLQAANVQLAGPNLTAKSPISVSRSQVCVKGCGYTCSRQ